MASYLITGRTAGGAQPLSIHVDAINQEDPIVEEMAVINAVKAFVMTVPGVITTVTQKTESVTTIV